MKTNFRNSECFCGNTLSNPTITSTCTSPCPGNTAQYCGNTNNGGWYSSVYSQGKLLNRKIGFFSLTFKMRVQNLMDYTAHSNCKKLKKTRIVS